MKSLCLRWSGATRILLCLTIILTLFSASAFSGPTIDDETCLACHEGMETSLAYTPHRLSSEIDNAGSQITCAGCHEGAEAHADDPSADNIANPARQDSFDKRTGCFQCHVAHVGLDNYGWDVHADQAIDCSNCHRIHSADDGLLLDDNAEFCYACHDNIHNDLAGRSNHPVADGVVTCLDCHKFVMRTGQNVVSDLQQTCRNCHPQQAGPYPFEHAPTTGYSVEGGGCMECHQAHSSESDLLLSQPGNLLCKQCHFPVGHTTAHGGIYADLSCENCHTDVHGSFVSNLFLDANLPSQFATNCYNTGCHSLIR